MPSKTKPNKTMFPSPLVVKFYTNMFNKQFIYMKFFMCYCNIFLYIKYWREKNKNPDPELHLDLYLGLDPDPY